MDADYAVSIASLCTLIYMYAALPHAYQVRNAFTQSFPEL